MVEDEEEIDTDEEITVEEVEVDDVQETITEEDKHIIVAIKGYYFLLQFIAMLLQ